MAAIRFTHLDRQSSPLRPLMGAERSGEAGVLDATRRSRRTNQLRRIQAHHGGTEDTEKVFLREKFIFLLRVLRASVVKLPSPIRLFFRSSPPRPASPPPRGGEEKIRNCGIKMCEYDRAVRARGSMRTRLEEAGHD